MPVIPEIDSKTCTLEELLVYIRACKEYDAVIERNLAVAQAMIDRGQKLFPMGLCPDCPDHPQPVRDDGTIECPTHGVLHGPAN